MFLIRLFILIIFLESVAEEYLLVHNKLHIPKKELQGRKEGRKESEKHEEMAGMTNNGSMEAQR